MMCMRRITDQYVLTVLTFIYRSYCIVVYCTGLCYIVLRACIALIPTRGAKAF